MKLVISSFLRTLRERDEFDKLLPDLVLAMGYRPLVRPQTGVRQFGVDLPVVGTNPDDKVEELVLFTIKRGDVGRHDWSSGSQAVGPSLDEIRDVYLTKDVEPAHQKLRKRIVLATTGDLKQDAQRNWTAYCEKYKHEALFEFWGGDKVAELIERYMLDEHVFFEEDRTDLRKALAFAGERDYSMTDLDRMLMRQLGLVGDGTLAADSKDGKHLAKALTRLNLALHMFTKAAQDAGDTRQALWAAERFILKAWHRIQLSQEPDDRLALVAYTSLVKSYLDCGLTYLRKISPYVQIREGMSGYCRESSEYAVVLQEHIGLIASVGLSVLCIAGAKEGPGEAAAVADLLVTMLDNMEATGSPRLDENAVDIALALLLLTFTDRIDAAKQWLEKLCVMVEFAFARRMGFPISSDSFDDLVDITVHPDETLLADAMGASWLTATLATWCAVLEMDAQYGFLASRLKERSPTVRPQLWHPDAESVKRWYSAASHRETGDTEVIDLPLDIGRLRERMKRFFELDKRDVMKTSPALRSGFYCLDYIASRHYRTPVPARNWYGLAFAAPQSEENVPSKSGPEQTTGD
ncbi:hypothetical protein BTHE68_41150 [Burkholderia sp. THE68]|uniref:hypothetical protein n=1 Tax=Burkholderia sp. THE68 TaxID=758782 RepID=UPI0013198BFF|nr:hypothetical protein [Burkholderia sp. THE68]BBU30381.1 hypothetical protein BTHE68_41150 [Burkholderia sp. THE68]